MQLSRPGGGTTAAVSSSQPSRFTQVSLLGLHGANQALPAARRLPQHLEQLQHHQAQQQCRSDLAGGVGAGVLALPLTNPQQQLLLQHQQHRKHRQQQQHQQQQQPSSSSNRQLVPVLPLVAAHQLWAAVVHSLPAHAAAMEAIPPEALTLFREFLDQIAALGPWGGVLFVLTVMTAEMVPLFPTQPLTLASGLLFGPVKGALFVVLGVTLAAVNAYSLSRGVGKQLAQKVIAAEMSGEKGHGKEGGAIAKQLAAVTQAIEAGGFMRQVTAITLLRLTPVVPFSASNYLLGLTPVQLGPLVVGTVAGMSVWSILYASLGGASKALLEGGADLDVLLADLGQKAGQYSSDVAVLGAVVGVLLGGGYLLTQRLQQQQQQQQALGGSNGSSSGGSSQQPDLPLPPALEAPIEEVLQGQQK